VVLASNRYAGIWSVAGRASGPLFYLVSRGAMTRLEITLMIPGSSSPIEYRGQWFGLAPFSLTRREEYASPVYIQR
jgi:hypothetical protein